jgi:Transposase DDE domain
MIATFEDFVIWMYVLIDTYWQQVAHKDQRPGPAPQCTDPELLTLLIVGECAGWHTETTLLAQWQAYRHLFPRLPERSRLNRRRRALAFALNDLRRVVLGVCDLARDRQCAIDSLPVPVINFHLVPGSRAVADWKAYGAAFGYVASKKQHIFGYKLTLLVSLGGLILDFELAPANVPDREVGAELLAEHAALDALGDKAYISGALAEELDAACDVHLLTVPRRNQRQQLPEALCQLHRRCRQIIETVNDQLSEQFAISVNHAHSFGGLCARLYTKLTAHTLCVHLNRLLGKEDYRHIKSLAFPN